MDLDEFLDGPLMTSSGYSTAGGNSHGHSKYSDTYKLVPIDHGYCLPSALHIDEFDWAWFYCPHVEVEVQPEIREYMNSLDIELLLADLTAQLPVSADCLFLLRVTHALIKDGINAGLSLRDIASMIARTDEDVPSVLENAIASAEDNAQRTIESRAGRRHTTSPAFLKSMETAANATYLAAAQRAVTAAQGGQGSAQSNGQSHHSAGIAGSESRNSLLGGDGDRDSPESPSAVPPVVVRQRSIGSPRSAGSSSPPQRIGGHKRIASTPLDMRRSHSGGHSGENDSKSSKIPASGDGSGGKGGRGALLRTRSSSEEDEFPHTIITSSGLGSAHKTPLAAASKASTGGSSGGQSQGSVGMYRPFPVRSTPDRLTRGVSSELNLESLGSLQGFGSPAFGSPNPHFGTDGRGTSYSLSSSSRSPLPLPLSSAERALYKPRGSLDGTGAGSIASNISAPVGGAGALYPLNNPNLSVNIGYLSSENIQKHQASPSISAAKFPEFLFRDPVRQPTSGHSRHTSNVSAGDHGAGAGAGTGAGATPGSRTVTAPSPPVGNGDQYGDYFMNDLSLVPPGVEDPSTLPLHLVSSNSTCSSPHSAFVMLSARERLSPRTAASSSEKLAAKASLTASAPVASGHSSVNGGSLARGNAAASATSLSSASSSSSVGKNPFSASAAASAGVAVPIVRPRPGEPIITMRSFDADYVRVHKHYTASGSGAGSAASSSGPSPVPSHHTSNSSSRANLAVVDGLFSSSAVANNTNASSSSAPTSAASDLKPGAPLQRVQVPVHTVRETSNTSNSSGVTSTSGFTASTAEPRFPCPAAHFGGGGSGIGGPLGGSLFASDSDLTASHSVATSYESAWSGSPKQHSPKLGHADGFECSVRAGSALSSQQPGHHLHHGHHHSQHQASGLLRESESSLEGGYLSDRSPRTINSGSLDNQDQEHEGREHDHDLLGEDCSPSSPHAHMHLQDRMLMVDGPVHTVPLKDMHDRSKLNLRTLSSHVDEDCGYDLINTDTEGEGEEPSPARHSAVHLTAASSASVTHNHSNKNYAKNQLSDSPASLGPTDALLHPVSMDRDNNNNRDRDSLTSRYSPTPSTLTTASAAPGTGLRPPGFHRVSSFAAFESPPLYSLPKNDRKGVHLKMEKRKAMMLTQEYQDLRLSFCKETISSALLKLARSKGNHH